MFKVTIPIFQVTKTIMFSLGVEELHQYSLSSGSHLWPKSGWSRPSFPFQEGWQTDNFIIWSEQFWFPIQVEKLIQFNGPNTHRLLNWTFMLDWMIKTVMIKIYFLFQKMMYTAPSLNRQLRSSKCRIPCGTIAEDSLVIASYRYLILREHD